MDSFVFVESLRRWMPRTERSKKECLGFLPGILFCLQKLNVHIPDTVRERSSSQFFQIFFPLIVSPTPIHLQVDVTGRCYDTGLQILELVPQVDLHIQLGQLHEDFFILLRDRDKIRPVGTEYDLNGSLDRIVSQIEYSGTSELMVPFEWHCIICQRTVVGILTSEQNRFQCQVLPTGDHTVVVRRTVGIIRIHAAHIVVLDLVNSQDREMEFLQYRIIDVILYAKGMLLLLPDSLEQGRIGLALIVGVCMFVAVLVYFIALLLLRAFNKAELLQMPMGARVYRLARTIGLMD